MHLLPMSKIQPVIEPAQLELSVHLGSPAQAQLLSLQTFRICWPGLSTAECVQHLYGRHAIQYSGSGYSGANTRRVLIRQWTHSAVTTNAMHIKKKVRCSVSKIPVPAEMPRVLALPPTREINRSPFRAISHSSTRCEIFISQICNSVFFIFMIFILYTTSGRKASQFRMTFPELMRWRGSFG